MNEAELDRGVVAHALRVYGYQEETVQILIDRIAVPAPEPKRVGRCEEVSDGRRCVHPISHDGMHMSGGNLWSEPKRCVDTVATRRCAGLAGHSGKHYLAAKELEPKRCESLRDVTRDGATYTVRCNDEAGHEGNHDAGGGFTWEPADVTVNYVVEHCGVISQEWDAVIVNIASLPEARQRQERLVEGGDRAERLRIVRVTETREVL
jgi:hypothetical protein